jgi:two-component system, sensor histidine kinase LadS
MRLGRLLQVALTLVLMALPLRLWAVDLIESRAYYQDQTGKLTFAQVQTKTFTPYTGILTEGFVDSVYWLRLRIDPGLAQNSNELAGGFPPTIRPSDVGTDKLVLRVRPPYLDQVELFDPLEPDKGDRVTGNIMPWRDSEFGSLNHGFVIPKGDAPRDVWLRVAATSTLIVGVDVLPYDQMRASEKRQEMLNTLDAALNLFFIVWAGLLFAMRPDRLIGAFLLVMLVSFVYATNYMGYYRIYMGHWIGPQALDDLHSALVILLPAVYMLFSRWLLQDYRPRVWMMRVLLPTQYYFLVGWALLFLGYEGVALPVNAALAFVGQLWVCITLMFGVSASQANQLREPLISRGWVLGYSLLLVFLFGALTLPALGLIPATQTSLYRSIIQGAVPFLLMAVIVHMRNRRIEREQQRQVVRAEQMAASEKSRREDSEQFLAMLTHEIRTPLTVMAYAAKTDLPQGQLGEHVNAGIREIDELIERCVQADRADQAGLPLALTDTMLDELLRLPRARFISDRVQWDIDLSGVMPENFKVRTDLTLFDVVLNNLIDNALKYAPNDEPVQVRICRQDMGGQDGQAGFMVTVSNSPGLAGFPDENRVFEKYYRAPRAHIRTGSGLGLYVARSFAIKLGGHLNYHRASEKVCFELWLPL